jgi:hypothetical protein
VEVLLGVSGLKAIRVQINFEEKPEEKKEGKKNVIRL